ncbi:MAG: hypothetical protein OEV64_07700 [Desulfobulbaceae bacterium]|nr:hypothetical protein [Desulfobulbaceae bacterium]
MQKTSVVLTTAAMLTASTAVSGHAAQPIPNSIFVSEVQTVQEDDLTGPGHSMETETTIPGDVFGKTRAMFIRF